MSTFATLEAAALSDEVRVIGFRGTERLCRPYELEIFVQVEGPATVGDLGDVIATRAKLQLQRGQDEPQRFHGILGNVSLLQQTASWALYRLLLVPRLWQLGLTRHSRVFTKQAVPAIIETVLTEVGFGGSDFELRLDGSYADEELVVQYGESKLDFLHRWMEREGLYYFFEQGESAEKLVIVDHGSFHQPMVDKKVRYFPLAGHDASAGECFDTFTAIRSATVGKVRLADYDYGRPKLDVSADAKVSDRGFGEMRMHAGRFFDPDQAKHYAQIRGEELKASELIYHAAGTALHMSAGYQVEVADHATDAFNTKYLLTEVHHFCNQLHQAGESHSGRFFKPEHDDVYRVEMKATDASKPYRAPQATTWPRVWGYEAGVVDGPVDSEYAQLDDQGRYLVKLKLDESDLKEGKASTHLRMMQPHGGTTEGWHFPLRKGTEVIIAFLGGDPDRPIIAGVVPNAETPSPVTSDNQTWNVIQTGANNRIRINDQKGEEYIDISTPYDKSILAMGFPTSLKGFGQPPHDVEASIVFATEGTAAFSFGGNWEIEVAVEKNELVGSHVSESYSANHRTEVAGDFDHTVGGAHTVKIAGTRDDSVDGGVNEQYGASLDTLVLGPHSHTVSGAQNVVVAGAQSLQTGPRTDLVKGNSSQTVNGSAVINCIDLTLTAPGGFKQTCSSNLTVNTADKTTLTFANTLSGHLGVAMNVFAGAKLNAEYSLAISATVGVKAEFGAAINARKFPTVVDSTPVWVRAGAQNILMGMSQFMGPTYLFL